MTVLRFRLRWRRLRSRLGQTFEWQFEFKYTGKMKSTNDLDIRLWVGSDKQH